MECYGRPAQFYHQGWYNNVIAVDPKNEKTVWVGGVDLFRSDDGGLNWGMASFWHVPPAPGSAQPNPRYVHADHHAIIFHPQFDGAANQTMLVGTDGGIFRTESARAQTASGARVACSPNASQVVWTSLNNGYSVTQFYHGVPFPGGAAYIGGAQDNGVVLGSDEAGVNDWKEVLSGDGGYVAVDWNNPKIIYAETTGLSLKRSTDGGVNFSPATTGISNIGFNFIAPFVMDPGDPNRLWIGGKQMWRTRNGAGNWSQASADLSGSATAIAVARADPNFVLVGTPSGHIHRTTTGLNSDADTAWPYAIPRSGYVSGVAFDPSNRDVAYATYSTFGGNHVWRSNDGGATWLPIDGAGAARLPDIPVNCVAVDPTNRQRIYVGTDMGIFVSVDGVTWAVENTGFANAPVESLSFDAAGHTTQLFAFTHGRGVWRVPLAGGCANSVSPANQTVGVRGGRHHVTVSSSGNDCQWTAGSHNDWITITSDTSGRGSGTVTYDVAPNPHSSPRKGTISVAGSSVTVVQAAVAVSVSAASLRGELLAPESIVSAFGAGLAGATQLATVGQLPMVMANTVVTVKDSAGVERRAPLFFISPNQVNYQMPKDIADGPATVTIVNGDDGVFSGDVTIARVAPGLFTADASGQGVAAGLALRVRVTGAQDSFAGLDQINLQAPRTLAGRGEVQVVITVDGQQANTVRISIK